MAYSPIGLGFGTRVRVKLGSRYVYVAESDRFFDRSTGQIITARSLDNLYAHEIRAASKELLQWERCAKVQRLTYAPGHRSLFVEDALGCGLNLWEPGPLKPQPGSWPHIAGLFQELFTVPQGDHTLDVIAFILQHPGCKVTHALVIRGPQGSGKSTFAKLIAMLVGQRNARSVDGSAMVGRWWDDFVNVVLLVVEEVSLADRREVSNRAKTLLTEREIRVESKGLPFQACRTPDLVIVLSNLEVPLALEDSDRRAFVPDYGRERREPAFYSALHAALEVEAPAFLAAMLERDVSAFNRSAPPPMTEAKGKLIADGRTDIQRHLAEQIADRQGVFSADIVIISHVTAALRSAGFNTANDGLVRRALADVGAKSCRHQLPPSLNSGGMQWAGEPRVWTIRNIDQWVDATKAELRNHLMDHRSGRSPGNTV
jgi:energy-coupling factor transporter ATP-binding protein EcfA2